jgi:uridine kinase
MEVVQFERFLREVAKLDEVDESKCREMFYATSCRPLHRALFSSQLRQKELFHERFKAWPLLRKYVANTPAMHQIQMWVIWEYMFGIAQFLRRQSGMIFGIAGGAGAGKTTLATLVCECLHALDPSARSIHISLDDFHLPESARQEKGIRWRSVPGTHNVGLAASTLNQIRNGASRIQIPRYDNNVDDVTHFDVVDGPVSIALFEGWLVGKRDEGYEAIARELDFLIYLDCPIELARKRRFARAYARLAGHDEPTREKMKAEMKQFWDEVQSPGYYRWVLPVRNFADLTIQFDAAGEIAAIDLRR